MNFLVTGLCISRNLGGPAMALTLIAQLRNVYPEAQFTFAVDPFAYHQERRWAEYYGVKIVRTDKALSNYINTNSFLRCLNNSYRRLRGRRPVPARDIYQEVHDEFAEALSHCDAVINMMGIAYVGDGTRGFLEGPNSYSNRYYANRFKKPFVHFIQSFGPFNDWKVRLFAKLDFSQAAFILARGKECARHCRSIVSNPDIVYDFPDIAILLPAADPQWTAAYLTKLGVPTENYVILSPSSAVYHLPAAAGGVSGEAYIEAFYEIAKKLIEIGKVPLFLPHMYSDDKWECDREICRKVVDRLARNNLQPPCYNIVEDELDVWQAKALIAEAESAIVSRYHALVAAVSTGVPAITVGWNIKYSDLMEYYGMESMALDTRHYEVSSLVGQVFTRLETLENEDFQTLLKRRQATNVSRLNTAFALLCDWIDQQVG